MKPSIWILISVVAVMGVVAWLVLRPGTEIVVVDLLAEYPNAVEKRPAPEIFSLVDATLDGETKPAILVEQASRIAWNVTMPDNAWLYVSAGLTEEAWTMEGDGVLFRVSVNDDELLNLVINPYGDPSFRGWQDYILDLSEYAGENVNVFLKTNASLPGANDTRGDFAVWGTPRIVVH